MKTQNSNIKIEHVSVELLKAAEYNPRRWSKEAEEQLKESIDKFGVVDPLLVNSAENRKNIVIGGHFRLSVMKSIGITTVPVVYINIPDIEKEKELNIRLNKNTGEFDFSLLATFDEAFLSTVGFSSEDLDDIFAVEETPEMFDLEKELKKLNIETPHIIKNVKHIYLRYALCFKERQKLINLFRRNQVDVGCWFDSPIYPLKENMSLYGYDKGNCPNADKISKEMINLPTHSDMNYHDIKRIINILKFHKKIVGI